MITPRIFYILKIITVIAPSKIIVMFFKESFSLKSVIPKMVESRITEMFCSGKNAALLIRPARMVLNKLAPPKQRPAITGKTTLRF